MTDTHAPQNTIVLYPLHPVTPHPTPLDQWHTSKTASPMPIPHSPLDVKSFNDRYLTELEIGTAIAQPKPKPKR